MDLPPKAWFRAYLQHSPSNVFTSTKGSLRATDWGCAYHFAEQPALLAVSLFGDGLSGSDTLMSCILCVEVMVPDPQREAQSLRATLELESIEKQMEGAPWFKKNLLGRRKDTLTKRLSVLNDPARPVPVISDEDANSSVLPTVLCRHLLDISEHLTRQRIHHVQRDVPIPHVGDAFDAAKLHPYATFGLELVASPEDVEAYAKQRSMALPAPPPPQEGVKGPLLLSIDACSLFGLSQELEDIRIQFDHFEECQLSHIDEEDARPAGETVSLEGIPCPGGFLVGHRTVEIQVSDLRGGLRVTVEAKRIFHVGARLAAPGKAVQVRVARQWVPLSQELDTHRRSSRLNISFPTIQKLARTGGVSAVFLSAGIRWGNPCTEQKPKGWLSLNDDAEDPQLAVLCLRVLNLKQVGLKLHHTQIVVALKPLNSSCTEVTTEERSCNFQCKDKDNVFEFNQAFELPIKGLKEIGDGSGLLESTWLTLEILGASKKSNKGEAGSAQASPELHSVASPPGVLPPIGEVYDSAAAKAATPLERCALRRLELARILSTTVSHSGIQKVQMRGTFNRIEGEFELEVEMSLRFEQVAGTSEMRGLLRSLSKLE